MSDETPTQPTDEQLLALPSHERARLAQLLLESLEEEDEEDADVEAAWAAELVRRVEDIRAHPEKAIPWEDVQTELQGRSRRR